MVPELQFCAFAFAYPFVGIVQGDGGSAFHPFVIVVFLDAIILFQISIRWSGSIFQNYRGVSVWGDDNMFFYGSTKEEGGCFFVKPFFDFEGVDSASIDLEEIAFYSKVFAFVDFDF